MRESRKIIMTMKLFLQKTMFPQSHFRPKGVLGIFPLCQRLDLTFISGSKYDGQFECANLPVPWMHKYSVKHFSECCPWARFTMILTFEVGGKDKQISLIQSGKGQMKQDWYSFEWKWVPAAWPVSWDIGHNFLSFSSGGTQAYFDL